MLLPLGRNLRCSYYEHKLFIFDFDGVILESVDARRDAFYQLFDEHGVEVCQRVLSLHDNNPGIDRREKIRRCYQEVLHIEPPEYELDDRVARFGELAKALVLECPLVAGVSTFIQSLRPENCYVVSVATQDEVREIVKEKGLASWFAGVFGGPKTKTEIIGSILEQDSVLSHQAVFVGDKISDFNAASKVGVGFYGRLPDPKINPFPSQVPVFTDYNQLLIDSRDLD